MSHSRWHELWTGPSLDEATRASMAKRVVRWLLVPLWTLVAVGVLTVFATLGFSEPTRYAPAAIFYVASLFVVYLARRQRWLLAAAALAGACTVAIASSALMNSVHAPLYRAGILLIWLVVPLFGARWGVVTAAALMLAGAGWLVLDYAGLSTSIVYPSAQLSYSTYILQLVISIALVSVPQRMLIDSLREVERKRKDAEDARSAEAAAEHAAAAARSAGAASELALDAVFDQSSVALALLSAEGRIVQLNVRAARLFGVADSESLLGLALHTAVAWGDEQRELLLHAVEQAAEGLVSRHEVALARRDDKPGVFHLTVSPFRTASGKVGGVIVEAVDVSALIEARTMLAQARRLEALGKLSGGVAHDINNMLGAVGGACDLIRLDLERRNYASVKENTALIQASVSRAGSLTKQLLAFGRQDRFNSVRIDVHRLVEEIARLLQRTLHKNVEVVHAMGSTPAHVRGDAAALEHALLNLALNAQDSMPGGGTITIATHQVELDSQTRSALQWEGGPGPAILISVTDTGTGMSAEVRERAFEPFFTTKSVANGTGLGLPAVHGTVRSHSGAITLASRVGVGSTIEIYLPALIDVVEAPRQISSPPTGVPRLKARVVVADDEPLVRRAVVGMLESLGCQVQSVDGGEALLKLLAEGIEVDLIVSDLAMPGLSGVKLVQLIEHHHPSHPLLLITGFTGDDVSIALPQRSLRRLLRKPFTRAELAQALDELLCEREAQEQASPDRAHSA